MDREAFFHYSGNSSRSRISYLSNVNNFIGESHYLNGGNLIEMLQNLPQENDNIMEENSVDIVEGIYNNHRLTPLNNSLPNSDSLNSVDSYDIFHEMSLLSKEGVTSSNVTSGTNDLFEDSDYLPFKNGRASTAPARPINEAEEFKWSIQFINLEKAVWYSNRLIQLKPDSKFDVDSEEGSEFCKKFLELLEKLIKSLKIPTCSRDYRKSFSRAYKYLYQEGNLCYLTEILDSAQEGIQCLWVNGEKFSFSKEVLDFGTSLFTNFCHLLTLLRTSYHKARDDSFYENIQQIKLELRTGLEDFDKKWVSYEQKYINELIFIENESRRFVTGAIEIEKELTTFEVRAKCRGKILLDSEDYNKMRGKLVDLICQINKVANSEGKGRDDLTVDILIAAEGVMRKISDSRSKSLRHLAENIKKSFVSMRKLLQKYEDNIEIVDPQLKNNPELVDCLVSFETTWEKGKDYLLDMLKYSQLLFFSGMIEILCDKYKDIAEQLDSRDPTVFVWVPSILILKSLDNEDKSICREFNPHMFDPGNETTARLYIFLKNFKDNFYTLVGDQYFAYNLLERLVLFEDQSEVIDAIAKFIDKSIINEFKKNLKTLSMQIQRVKPGEWNHFIDLAMNIV